MPKLAATLASLLLIGSSLGINIARYPQVGRTVGEADRPAAGQHSESDVSIAQTPPPSPLPSSQLPSQATSRPLAAQAQVARPQAPDTTPIRILGVRPLVPIVGLVTDGTNAPISPLQDEVRRLPPIDESLTALARDELSQVDETYPTTNAP